jgi:hypothetical protein
LTVAGIVPSLPGRKNSVSTMLLPTGANRRNGLNVPKVVSYVSLLTRSPRPPGVACVSPSPLTSRRSGKLTTATV